MLVVMQVARGVMLHLGAVGRDRRDAAVEQRGRADPAFAVDGERVEVLHAGQAVQQAAQVERYGFGECAHSHDGAAEHPPGRRLGPVQRVGVRRQADAVRALHREHDLPDLGPIRLGVVDRRQVAGAGGVVADAVIGEIEAAVAVNHQIVRRAERPAVALGVQVGDGAVVRIDPLDPAAEVAIGHEHAGEHHPAELGRREAAAVVAQVDRSVGPDRRTVGTALDLGDRRLGAVRRRPA